MLTHKIVIVARGKTDKDVQDAIEEAWERIQDGNLTGADSNETSGFYFTALDTVPANELPA